MNDQHIVKFQGTEILTFSENNKHYIAIKPLCETFGIDWSSQHKRINRDELFNSTMVMMTTVGADGKQREMTCLPLETFPMWLARIDTTRVKNPFAAELILEYQKEATEVLYQHFLGSSKKDQAKIKHLNKQIEYASNQEIALFKRILFSDNHEMFMEARWAWRLYDHYRSYSKMATAVEGWSSSKFSNRVKKYQHFLDATRISRLRINEKENGATIYDLWMWTKGVYFTTLPEMIRALSLRDMRLEYMNRVIKQHESMTEIN